MSIRQDQRRLREAERRRQLAARSPDDIREAMTRAILESMTERGRVERADLLKADIPPEAIDADFARCLGVAKMRDPKLFKMSVAP